MGNVPAPVPTAHSSINITAVRGVRATRVCEIRRCQGQMQLLSPVEAAVYLKGR